MTEPTYTKADIEAARAMALREAAEAAAEATWRHEGDDAYSRGLDHGACHQASECAANIRALSPDAAAILAERDRAMKAQGYREALEAAADRMAAASHLYPDNVAWVVQDDAEEIRAMSNPYEGER